MGRTGPVRRWSAPAGAWPRPTSPAPQVPTPAACHQLRAPNRAAPTMKEFFLNVTRYPRYLVAFGLGVFQSVLDPLLQRLSNPVTAVALVGALVSGLISMILVLRAMVTPAAPIG